MTSKWTWIAVLALILYIFSYFELEFFFEKVLFAQNPEANKEFLYLIFQLFQSLQKGLKNVFDFLLSWKGVALVVIYIAQKLIRERYNRAENI